jgi:hypothetical protein
VCIRMHVETIHVLPGHGQCMKVNAVKRMWSSTVVWFITGLVYN